VEGRRRQLVSRAAAVRVVAKSGQDEPGMRTVAGLKCRSTVYQALLWRVCCAGYHCSHWTAISGDLWPELPKLRPAYAIAMSVSRKSLPLHSTGASIALASA